MIKHLYDWTIHWAMTPQAEWALLLIAFAESSFFPLPPDILMIAMAVGTPKGSFIFASICTFGSVMGGVFGYGIGLYGGRPILKKFVKEKTIAKVEDLFKRYDAWAIAIAGFTPIPYKVFTIASGAFKIKLKTFVLASILGRAGRFFLVATLFYFWGVTIHQFIEKYFDLVSIAFVVLLAGGFLAMRLLKNKKENLSAPA